MSFYSEFAGRYEEVFPFREPVLAFLAARLPAGRARVLDLGCGTGHYCGRLAAAGHDAMGIDLDPAMVAAAERAYPAARFRVLDLLELDRVGGPFDLACCLGNVLAHLPPRRLPDLLAKLRAALRPGAAWLFQTVNWDQVLGLGGNAYRFPDRILPDGTIFAREYRDIAPQRVRFVTRLSAPDREIFAGEVELHPVRAGEYRRLHAAAGFVEEGHWADFAGAPFRPDAEGGSVFAFRRP